MNQFSGNRLPPPPKVDKGVGLSRLFGLWEKDKTEEGRGKRYISETKRDYREFCRLLKHDRVILLRQLTDKQPIKLYRSKIKRNGNGSDCYYSSRFRRVKALLNHVLAEHDLVPSAESAAIRENVRLLKCKTTKSDNRPITPDELHALLAACDRLAATDVNALKKRVREYRPKSAQHQELCGKIRQAQNARFLGIQFKAAYLIAANCMFYPTDIGTIPLSAVDLATGHVKFRRKKKNTPRAGLLFEETIQALKPWLAIRPGNSPNLFMTTTGSEWNKQSVMKQLNRHKEISAELGKPLAADLSFSSLRDGGYAAALLDPHVDLYTAKVMSGHATGITDSYVDAQPERCRLAAESIRRHYFGGNK